MNPIPKESSREPTGEIRVGKFERDDTDFDIGVTSRDVNNEKIEEKKEIRSIIPQSMD